MSLQKACELAGSPSALAKQLGITPTAVFKWLKRDKVPAERVLQIERLTNGVIHRSSLRPDCYPPNE